MGSEMCIERKHHSSDVRQDKTAKVKTLKHPPTKISTRTGILLEPRPRPLFLESGFSIQEKRFLDLLAIPSPTANAKNKNKKKDCFEETSIAKEAKSILAGIIASHQSQRKMGVPVTHFKILKTISISLFFVHTCIMYSMTGSRRYSCKNLVTSKNRWMY